ncbi:MAG TPA: T9SS type A sorting domain-containing protein [Puia sp.]|nr:T9SS type A sorting domain-containing protein [Puia sp.]
MKKVYSDAVIPYGTSIKERMSHAFAGLNAGISHLRLRMIVMLGFILIFNTASIRAQNCATSGTHSQNTNENTYYPATNASLAAGATSITLGAAGSGTNFGTTPIAIGDIIFIIQMQGAQINVPGSISSVKYGSNSTPGRSSGFISTGLQAGNMEFAVATNAVPLAGGVLNISAGLTNAYSNAAFGANGQYTYQVIRVPNYFNIQLTAPGITTPSWNGKVGGVTVIDAVSQLDLNGQTINAVGAGFRGGAGIAKSGAAGAQTDEYTMSTNNANGSKGEGIAGTPKYVNYNFTLIDNVVEGYPSGSFAMGAPGNAGGGATDSNPPSNDQNAGGGGGGNGGSGGRGGNGWFTVGVSGGYGGSAFKTTNPAVGNYASPSRLIMGGGGGAGDTNNSTGTIGALSSSGASGGGIVIISAGTIMNAGTINASGGTFDKTVKNDGSGGGGAGGSILIYANSGLAGITAIANGGNGINNYPSSASATQHGPGGGGGGGVIFSNAAINVASSANGGLAGVSFGSSSSANFGEFPGVAGILTTTFPFAQLPPNMQICQSIVLPVTILSFSANYVAANNVKVSWSTTDEVNASYFVVERSSNGTDFMDVSQVNASESTNPIHNYNINDQLYNVNSNVVYYRLRIVDKDGKYSYSKIIPVKLDQPENSISVYPNPVDNYAIVNLYSDKPGSGVLRLIDEAGRQILIKSFTVIGGNNNLTLDQLGHLPKGIYVIQVMLNNNLYNQKIVKK